MSLCGPVLFQTPRPCGSPCKEFNCNKNVCLVIFIKEMQSLQRETLLIPILFLLLIQQ